MKIWQLLLGLALGLLLSGALYLVISPPRGEPLRLVYPPTPGPIQVHIGGAVRNPGVYSLDHGSKVKDVIEAAGGFQDSANVELLNLAADLFDGEKITVPTQKTLRPASTVKPGSPGLININTATADELETLPGIGPSKSAAILVYRQQHGDFKKIEDLLNVTGIGQSILENIKSKITLTDPQ